MTDEFLFKLENPQVYTGREINAARKTFSRDKVNVCLVFPDKYEIGMSHYGLILLYHVLNKMEKVNAERCFLPGKPSIKTFKTYNVHLFSLENKIPLKEFDIIGFSLLSEMNYTNVLQVLDLTGIPLRTRDREGTFPIIAAGGISAVNPEPLREFIDIFGIGDGEAIFPDIIAAVCEAKEKKHTKEALLSRLDNIKSVYVPALYPPVKKGRFYAPDLESGAIKKRVIKSIGESLPGDRVIVPLGNVIFDRLNVEIARGCPKNCRFCQAKSYYAPYRFASLGKNLQHIVGGIEETGFETFSLSTLSAGDYPYLNELLQLIPQVITVPGISFSLSSLRPSTLSHKLLSTIAMFRRTGITIAAEAGTLRLRNVINKDVTDDEIFQAVELALRNKWQKIKMYFMFGLPTETMEDIEGIVRLIRQVLQMAKDAKQKIKLHASFASFVPKSHTPLQWAKREALTGLREKIGYIKANLKGIRNLDLDVHVPHNGVVETILARGDYRVGELLLKAFENGEIFSAWDADFNYPVWEEMIYNSVYEEFLSEFSLDETLPWDFLQVNFKKDFMKKEYQNALAAVPTPSCAQRECKDCSGCIYTMKQPEKEKPLIREITQSMGTGFDEKPGEPVDMVYNKTRIFYEKTGDFIFFSQLTMMKYIERLIRKSGIVFKCSAGFTPRIKIMSLPPLPVFATGLDEVVEIFVDASLKEGEILERLNRSAAPEGLTFKSVVECNDTPPLSRDIHFMGYEIIVKDLPGHVDDIAQHLGETDFASFSDNRLILTMDYSKKGQERFAKIYKIIDPGKERTMYLTRTHVKFKS
jgi:radical SAM family uncharacterized protein/radical SAM-linked protein